MNFDKVVHSLEVIITELAKSNRAAQRYAAGMLVHQIGMPFGAVIDSEQHVAYAAHLWIHSAEWDGTDRITALYDTLKKPEGTTPALHARYLAYLRYWLRLAYEKTLARSRESTTNAQQKHMLILEGPRDCGKTQWVRHLVGADHDRQQELVRLGGVLTHQTTVMWRSTTPWISEITGISRQLTGDTIQSMISWSYDDAPKSPEHKRRWRVRRTAFIGTTRSEMVLPEDRSRALLTIPVDSCSVSRSQGGDGPFLEEINMQQLWAQVARSGTTWLEAFYGYDVRAYAPGMMPQDCMENALVEPLRQGAMGKKDIRNMFEPLPEGTPTVKWLSGSEARSHYLKCIGVSPRNSASYTLWEDASDRIEQLWGPKVKASVIRYPIKKRELA